MNSILGITIYDGIRHIEALANSENDVECDRTQLAGEVSAAANGMVSCTSIHQLIPNYNYQHICSDVKTKMITALMELEKIYGNFDTLGIDISQKSPQQAYSTNADLNRAVFNINVPFPEAKKERWYSKIA